MPAFRDVQSGPGSTTPSMWSRTARRGTTTPSLALERGVAEAGASAMVQAVVRLGSRQRAAGLSCHVNDGELAREGAECP
jgi:hypothetical protein